LQKGIAASALEFKILERFYDEYHVNDETLKKLAIVLNSANKIHTLNLDFSRW